MQETPNELPSDFWSLDYPPNRYDVNAPWPIHPHPLRGESMSSWIARQAFGNGYAFRVFIVRYLQDLTIVTDYEFLSPESKSFKVISKCMDLQGGRKVVEPQSMTFSSLQSALCWQRGESRSWATPVKEGRRFCPACLSEDETPYFRLAWRVSLLPICLKHTLILKSQCEMCRAPVLFTHLDEGTQVGVCADCGHALSETAIDKIGKREEGYIAVSNMMKVLKKGEMPDGLSWPYSTSQWLNSLLFVFRLLCLLRQEETTGRQTAARDDRGSVVLVGKAWSMLLDYPTRLERFLEENRFLVRAVLQNHPCPIPLRRYGMRFQCLT